MCVVKMKNVYLHYWKWRKSVKISPFKLNCTLKKCPTIHCWVTYCCWGCLCVSAFCWKHRWQLVIFSWPRKSNKVLAQAYSIKKYSKNTNIYKGYNLQIFCTSPGSEQRQKNSLPKAIIAPNKLYNNSQDIYLVIYFI